MAANHTYPSVRNSRGAHRQGIGAWLRELRRLLLPEFCAVCRQPLVGNERYLCLPCELALPYTDYHLQPENPLLERLTCHAPIERAAAMFHYLRQAPATQLIIQSKYEDRPQIDRYLATHYGAALRDSGFLQGIDLLLPVPMHWWKQLRRGFNQAEVIAQALGKVSGIPVGDQLVATRSHTTQTRHSATERLRNIDGIYTVERPQSLSHLHVAIIDDVVTTGSTVVHCAEAIHRACATTRLTVIALAAAAMQ